MNIRQNIDKMISEPIPVNKLMFLVNEMDLEEVKKILNEKNLNYEIKEFYGQYTCEIDFGFTTNEIITSAFKQV